MDAPASITQYLINCIILLDKQRWCNPVYFMGSQPNQLAICICERFAQIVHPSLQMTTKLRYVSEDTFLDLTTESAGSSKMVKTQLK